MGFFKRLTARLHSSKQLKAEKQVRTAKETSDKALEDVPDQTKTSPNEDPKSEGARRAAKLKKQSPIRISTYSGKAISSQTASRQSSLSRRSLSRSGLIEEKHVRTSSPPHPDPPLSLNFPLPPRLSARPDISRVSSLDHLAQGYSSGSASPEPDSIFGHRLTQSTNPSPASTISRGSFEHSHFKIANGPALATENLAVIPEKAQVEHATAAFPLHHDEQRAASRLSVQDDQKMRANIDASYATSSHDGDVEAVAPSVPEQTSPALPGLTGTKSLLAVANSAAEGLSESTKQSKMDISPPSIDEPRESSTRRLHPPLPNPARHGKQPVPARTRAESLTGSPSCLKSAYIYVRRERYWRTTAARFNAIFDAIPSSVVGARRENLKRDSMRKHRELG
ncbi:hypothetical protein P171DRAFT_525378 [Karstenula rhodostoma CBS 690.94]|uniref:Uncharacterized protein n=1 Tax=Karstenula rhodostoma CBS 690.94 TaxID=1392251 RepID=A0A9P4P903_9PLEO|nr:hypothetical protein P171DRAFT_525378 [Karstenula rhodostoma CBS 690.94]